MKSTTVFYLFVLLFRLGLGATLTLYVPWLESIGLSYAEIALLNAVYWISVIVLEIPTGMIADGRGRGWSVFVGTLTFSVGGLVYFSADSFLTAALGEIVLALGTAFISGALNAWIVDAPDRKKDLRVVFATATAIAGFAMIVAPMIAVPIVQATAPANFWLIKSGFVALAALLAWFAMQEKEVEHPMKEFEALRYAVAHLRASANLRWVIGAQMLTGIFGAFNMFWALLMLTKVTEIQLTWIWALMYSSLIVTGVVIRSRLADKISNETGMLLAIFVGSFPLALVWVVPTASIWVLLFMVHEAGRGAFSPFADSFVHERVQSGYRATFGSLQSFLGSLGMVVTLLLSALFMKVAGSATESIFVLWAIVGLFGVLTTALLWYYRPKDA